jgi:hypothetical protein
MMPAQVLRWSATAGGILFPVGIALHPLRHGEAVVASAYSAILGVNRRFLLAWCRFFGGRSERSRRRANSRALILSMVPPELFQYFSIICVSGSEDEYARYRETVLPLWKHQA